MKAPAACSEVSSTADDAALCSWYQLVSNVHRSVTELALRSTGRPTVFVVVGDHAPPFSASRLRSQFSDQVVPYVLLVPKETELREDLPTGRSFAVASRPVGGTQNSQQNSHLKSGTVGSFVAGGG